MLAELGRIQPEKRNVKKLPLVIPLADDWRTRGDWLGRYGRYWACLCAICSPKNYIWGAGPEKVEFASGIGPHRKIGDSLRYWVHWLYTKDSRALEMPPTYLHSRVLRGLTDWDVFRRQASFDDHSESYPATYEGPHIYFDLKVPEGQYLLSLYWVNKDGHSMKNIRRDYNVSIRPGPARERIVSLVKAQMKNPEAGMPLRPQEGLKSTKPLPKGASFEVGPELAAGRVRDFWGGVYKRYLVQGPCDITVYIRRNSSFCTILSGVFLDLVDEQPLPYFHPLKEWRELESQREKRKAELLRQQKARGAEHEKYKILFTPGQTEAEVAEKLIEALDAVQLTNPAWWATNKRRFYTPLLRWYRRELTQCSQETFHWDRLVPAPTEDDKGKSGKNKPKAEPPGPVEIPENLPPFQGRPAALAARLAACCHQLGLYPQWESLQRRLSLLPARDIEKSLRWDGVTYSCQGKGFQIVSEYLAGRKEIEAAKTLLKNFENFEKVEKDKKKNASDTESGNGKNLGKQEKKEKGNEL
jgi:hypothetical protein